MASSEKQVANVQDVSEILVNYAIDREDLKGVIAALPYDQGINTVTLDYELQLLKIISVGWSISVHMDGREQKSALSETFWHTINEFSKNVSEMSYLTIGQKIDYFELVKERLGMYIQSLEIAEKGSDPAACIGATFATCCKDVGNPFVAITGSRIFNMAVQGVKAYLGAITIQ